MSFREWIFSRYPENAGYAGQWKWQHIITLCLCVLLIVAIAYVFRKKKTSTREGVLKVLAILILVFEVTRRVVNFAKGNAVDFTSAMRLLLPRPWCAISCWLLIAAAVFNKKSLWNFASVNALLCAIIFFAYPSVGFTHKVFLFEDIYSIATHSLLLISSVSVLTLSVGDFRYKRETFKRGILKEIILFVCVFAYAFIEIYALKIGKDPLYFMPDNDVQKIFGMGYAWYLIVYALFLVVWVNAFYLIPMLWNKYVRKGRKAVLVEEGEEPATPQTVKTGRYLKTKGEEASSSRKKKNRR